MIALEVTLNGKKLVFAGADDLAVLSSIVTASGKLGKKTKSWKIKAKGKEYDLNLHIRGLLIA